MGLFKKLFRDKSRDEEFLRLCANGTVQEVKDALDSWGYLDAKNESGANVLMTSCFNPDSEVTKLLIGKFREAGRNIINEIDNNNNKWTALHYAGSFAVNPDTVRVLVQAGGMINAIDSFGQTPLMHAVKYAFNGALKDNTEVIKALIEETKKNGRGLEIQDRNGASVLNHAAMSNIRPEITKLLIEAGADIESRDLQGMPPVMSALFNPNPEIIKTLAEAGAKLDVVTNDGMPIVTLCIVIMMSKKDEQSIDLRPKIEHVKTLIELGANVDARINNEFGLTALMQACSLTCPPEVIKLLAENTKDINMKANNGLNALGYAFGMENKFAAQAAGVDPALINHENNKANIDILISHGAKINFSDLCRMASPERVKAALKSGADINERNSDGAAPLMLAFVDNPDPDVFITLIEEGADLNIRDNQGFTLLDIAVDMERYDTAETLERMGAQANIYRRR